MNTHPKGWENVAKEARLTKEEVHVGIVFGLVVEKNTDLIAGDPRRKFKDRVVFQGNNVENQNWETLSLRAWVARHRLWRREG